MDSLETTKGNHSEPLREATRLPLSGKRWAPLLAKCLQKAFITLLALACTEVLSLKAFIAKDAAIGYNTQSQPVGDTLRFRSKDAALTSHNRKTFKNECPCSSKKETPKVSQEFNHETKEVSMVKFAA